ncbi:MAG: bifunctional adenosylcobinamide kinase/adenosylcobinamide-phosphate guanylyltransferase [Gammaproteobacteria bacterium]|nr:bifunctional adenosylcobinamide kinase/adenosylcobinamide-phosphate guanylyltransferase [Gammaproteobacteria bacterium]
MKHLILGGVRSGKSAYAEDLAQRSGLEVCYIATAQAWDDEMRQRIELHQQRRPSAWRGIEEPLALAERLTAEAASHRCLLVDCLTLWLTNQLMNQPSPTAMAQLRQQLVAAVVNAPGQIILVSNETSLGVVPMGELSRRFCDEAGRLHQALAAECDRVSLVIAGLAQQLKG